MVDTTVLDELPDTPVPVLSNDWIGRLMGAKKIIIDPYDAERLAPTAYRLTSHRMRFYVRDEEGLHSIPEIINLENDNGRELRPGEYGVISPKEKIYLVDGFVADFYPSSWCIENNLLVTAGRLDARYNADLVFGVFNAGRSEVALTANFQLVRASFGWLGKKNIPSYDGPPPGAYIPQMEELRKREEQLDQQEEALRQARALLDKKRASLAGRRNAD